MENKKFIEPIFIKAGSNLLKLGMLRHSPRVDCRVIAEEGYRQLKEAYDRECARKNSETSEQITLDTMLGVSLPLSDYAVQKLEFINGHCTTRDFPNCKPTMEWAGAVLDLLNELKIGGNDS